MEKKHLSIDITMLKICEILLAEAKKALNDVDNTDELYAEIHNLREKIGDFRLKKEIELEEM